MKLRAALLPLFFAAAVLFPVSPAKSDEPGDDPAKAKAIRAYDDLSVSPSLALGLSGTVGLFVPGVGHYYAREYGRGALLTGLGYGFLVPISILSDQANPPDGAMVLLSLGVSTVWVFGLVDAWYAARRHNARLLDYLNLAESDVQKPKNAFQRFFNPDSPRSRPGRPALLVETGIGPVFNIMGAGIRGHLPLFEGLVMAEPFTNIGWIGSHPVATPGVGASFGRRHRGFLEYGQGIYRGYYSFTAEGLKVPSKREGSEGKGWLYHLRALDLGYAYLDASGFVLRAGYGEIYGGGHLGALYFALAYRFDLGKD